MKNLFLSITALLLASGVFAQDQKAAAPAAPQKKSDDVAKFKTELIELGKVKQDNPVTAIFEVTNISKEPLLIEQANPTCGCTISDYTKEPIAAGKTGYIKATYNAKNLGMFEKHLTVKFAGTDDMKSITIKGEVIKNEDAAAATPAVAPAAVVTDTKSESEAVKVATPSKTSDVAAPVKTATPAKTTTLKKP
jgi:hypothetical protein